MDSSKELNCGENSDPFLVTFRIFHCDIFSCSHFIKPVKTSCGLIVRQVMLVFHADILHLKGSRWIGNVLNGKMKLNFHMMWNRFCSDVCFGLKFKNLLMTCNVRLFLKCNQQRWWHCNVCILYCSWPCWVLYILAVLTTVLTKLLSLTH